MGKEENFGDKKNTNGFDKNPDNINTGGRPISIRQTLREMLEKRGEYFISKEQILRTTDEGIFISIPDDAKIALKLQHWALSKKGNDSLKAIQLIIEHIDGKPNQAVQISAGDEGVITTFSIPDNGRDKRD